VNSLDPKTRAKLHWKLPIKLKKAPPGLAPKFPSEITALAALDTVAIRQGAYDRANKAMRNALATECWLGD
jgi:hypothetical protein